MSLHHSCHIFAFPSPWVKKTEALINREAVEGKEAESRNKWMGFAFGEMHTTESLTKFDNWFIKGLEQEWDSAGSY